MNSKKFKLFQTISKENLNFLKLFFKVTPDVNHHKSKITNHYFCFFVVIFGSFIFSKSTQKKV